MEMTKEVKELIEKHVSCFDDEKYEPVILDIYYKCGAKGIAELRKIFIYTDIDIKPLDKSTAKIISGLLGV